MEADPRASDVAEFEGSMVKVCCVVAPNTIKAKDRAFDILTNGAIDK